jgi:uncharacterized protein YjiK
MCNVEYLHTSCVKISEENGKEVYFYKVYRGTHTYDTKEMAKLIDGTIQECKNVGIETATSDEIAHMQMLWENKIKRKKEENKSESLRN